MKPGKSDWTQIGKNHIGQTLYEDQRGVRSYIENGVRHAEPVRIIPGGGIEVSRLTKWGDHDPHNVYRLASESALAPIAPDAPNANVKSEETTWSSVFSTSRR